MNWTHLLHLAELLSIYAVILYICARIGGVTREDFRRTDKATR